MASIHLEVTCSEDGVAMFNLGVPKMSTVGLWGAKLGTLLGVIFLSSCCV